MYIKLEGQFDTDPFMYTYYFGNLRMVKMFVEYCRVYINKVDKLQKNSFMLACRGMNTDVIKYLLLKGINVNQKDLNGYTEYQYLNVEQDQQVILALID